MTEIFREVDEALRYDRLKAFGRKRRVPIIVAFALLLTATAAIQGWRTFQTQRTQRAAETFFQEITALSQEPEEGEVDGTPLAGGYRFLLPFHRAREAVEAKNWKEADRLLAEVLEQRALPELYRDYAHLQQALVSLGRARLGEAEERLRPLIAEESSTNPLQPLALFLQASLQVARGQTQAARETLDKALLSPFLPDALRERIEQARSALQGIQ